MEMEERHLPRFSLKRRRDEEDKELKGLKKNEQDEVGWRMPSINLSLNLCLLLQLKKNSPLKTCLGDPLLRPLNLHYPHSPTPLLPTHLFLISPPTHIPLLNTPSINTHHHSLSRAEARGFPIDWFS